MYQRPTIDALHKRAPNLKLKPGVFSDHSHFIAKPYTAEDTKKKGKLTQQPSDANLRRDKMTASSFENVFKGSTHMTSENDPASTGYDNETYGPEYVFNTNFNDLKPLEERVNRPPARASIGEKSLHSRSDKALDSHEDSHKNMRRQSSVSSLQKRSFQKNLPSYENVYASDAENRDNSPNLRVSHMSNGGKPKGNANFVSCDGDSNRSHNFSRTRSLGKINPHGENTKARTPEPSIMAYIEEKEEQGKVENIMKENMELWNNSKRMSAELQAEKNRALMLENELQALNSSMAEERAKYQEEFIKISQEIKKFQNIQNAYIKEKKSSQTLEQQLNVHEKALSDMTSFVRECLQTLLKELEIIIIKGDVAFEKNFKNQDFNPEDFFKFCSELKKPILQKLDAAEKQNFKFDWKTHDYDQLLRYNKELEKLRKAQDFKILSNKSTFEESYQKSLATNSSVSHNVKSPLNSALPQYNSSQNRSTRKNSLPRSINNSYKSNDNQDLNRSHESQHKADKYIPLNYRLNLAEFNVQPQSSKQDDHSITEDSESKNFSSKRRSVSVPKVHETDVSLQEILGGQISNPRLKDFSPVQQTFDNLLSEGIQSRAEQEMNVGDISTKQSEVSPLNKRGQWNELSQLSSQVDAGLDSIKSQILSRMSNIEARRRSSVEGARQFTLEINKVPSQELTHNDFVNRGITEKSMEETTPRTRVIGVETQRGEENLQDESEILKERPRSIEQNLNRSPISVNKGIAWSPVPKLNLMAYNNNNTEEKYGGLAKSGSAMSLSLHSNKEEKYLPEEEKTTPNDYQSLPYRSVHSRTPSHQSNASRSSGGDYAIANYEYEAQKENDLTFNCGDKIQILKKTDNGWWIGLCNNRIGYFPSNFVTLVPGNN